MLKVCYQATYLLAIKQKKFILLPKRFYNGETNNAAFCAIHRMYLEPPFPSITQMILTLFLIQGSQPIMKNGEEFHPMVKTLYPLLFL